MIESCSAHPSAGSWPSHSHHSLLLGFAAPHSKADSAGGGLNHLQLHRGGGMQIMPPQGSQHSPTQHWDRQVPKLQLHASLRPRHSDAFMFISHKYSTFLGQSSWKWLLEPIHTSFVVSQHCPPTPSLKYFSLLSVPGWVFVHRGCLSQRPAHGPW